MVAPIFPPFFFLAGRASAIVSTNGRLLFYGKVYVDLVWVVWILRVLYVKLTTEAYFRMSRVP